MLAAKPDEETAPIPDVHSELDARDVVRHLPLCLTVVLLVYLAWRTLFPLWMPLLLAAWFADLVGPISRKLGGWWHGKARAASLVTVLLIVTVLSPVAIVALAVTNDAAKLIRRARDSGTFESALSSVVDRGEGQNLSSLLDDPQRVFNLAKQAWGSAYGFASSLAGTAVSVVIGVVVFVATFYLFLVRGEHLGRWLQSNAPLSKPQFEGFSRAFFETGRGLLLGVGLTALVQGAIASVGYVIAGVPQAFVLALLTAAAALIPSLGSALVWAPVSAILFFTGDTTGGIVVLVAGGFASTVDNFIRPMLSRFGQLKLHVFVLFCAMLGGMLAFGATGILLGPLFVRLSLEGLRLWQQREAPLVI